MVGEPQDPTDLFRNNSMRTSERSSTVFTATDLTNAEIIGQVDRKFIACAIRDHPDGDILLIVDQHAADERVRVERFLQEYCEGALAFEGADIDDDLLMETTEMAQIQPSKLVLMSKQEAELLHTVDVRRLLKRWGIQLDDLTDSPNGNELEEQRVQVGVSAVPKLIESKVCALTTGLPLSIDSAQLLQARELQDVLKSVLGEVETNGVPEWYGGEEGVDEGTPRWLRAWRTCPNSLLNLINSKACRGKYS